MWAVFRVKGLKKLVIFLKNVIFVVFAPEHGKENCKRRVNSTLPFDSYMIDLIIHLTGL